MAGIVLTIEVDDRGTLRVKQFSDETKKAFDEMKKGPEQARAPMASIQESWVGLTAKVALATGVIYGVTRAFSSFVDEAAKAEEIENRLRFALETTGYTWQHAKSAVDQFANSIQDSTRFSDEQAREALTDMMMYTNDFAKAQTGAKLAMDMSIRTGQDLRSTSRLIGMAMSGNVEMLGRYIPQLRNLDAVLGSNASMADKAAYAMKILQEKFGGTAQADLNSYAGTVAQFKNQWSDLKEEIGSGLLPVLKDTFGWLTKILKEMRDQRELMKEAGATGFWSLESLGKPIPGMPYHAPEPNAPAWIKEWVAGWKPAAQVKTDIFPESKKLKEEDPLSAYNAIIEKANEWGEVVMARQALTELGWTKEKDIVEQVRDEIGQLERETNEWGEVTVARQEFVEAGWKKIAAIEEIVQKAAGVRKDQAVQEIEKMSKADREWLSLSENISSAWNFNVTGMLRDTEDFGDAFKKMVDGMADTFISGVSKMIMEWLLFESVQGGGKKFLGGGSAIGSVVGWIGGLLGAEGGIFPSWTPIKTFQHGGLVDRPTLGMFGEGGPEAVVPLKGGKIPIEGDGGGGNMILVLPWNYDKSFVDMIKRNPDAVLSLFRKNIRGRGSMVSLIRSVQ